MVSRRPNSKDISLIFEKFQGISFSRITNFEKFPAKISSLNGRRIYPFNKGLRIYGGVYHPPFDTLKIGTSTDDIKLKLYR